MWAYCYGNKDFLSSLCILFWDDLTRTADLGKGNVPVETCESETEYSTSPYEPALVTLPPCGTQGLNDA